MGVDIRLSIKGLQEAQKKNLRRVAALKPGGAMDAILQWAIGEVHRHWTYNTPHETGALRASRRIRTYFGNGTALVLTDPGATNPKSGTRPAEYDVYLHAQGFIPGLRSGVRASGPYTVLKVRPMIQRKATRAIGQAIRNA